MVKHEFESVANENNIEKKKISNSSEVALARMVIPFSPAISGSFVRNTFIRPFFLTRAMDKEPSCFGGRRGGRCAWKFGLRNHDS